MSLWTVVDDSLTIPGTSTNTICFVISTLVKLKVRISEVSSTGTTLTDTPALVQAYRLTGTPAGGTAVAPVKVDDEVVANSGFTCLSNRTAAITGLSLGNRLWASYFFFPSTKPQLELPDTGFVVITSVPRF